MGCIFRDFQYRSAAGKVNFIHFSTVRGLTKDVRNHVHRGRKKLIGYLREEVARYATTPQRHQTELEVMGRWLGGA